MTALPRRPPLTFLFCTAAFATSLSAGPASAAPDWSKTADEMLHTLQQYVRIDTSNPPGDTRKTAELLTGLLTREGLQVKRYESAPGKAILYARLPATVAQPAGKPILLLHHMDVVPADRKRWPVDPFSAAISDGHLWGRGAIDMKGIGVVHLYAFLTLKRQAVPRERDVIFMAVPDEEVGGIQGARWMIKNHYAELDPAYVLDEGGCGSRDLYAPGKLVYGISVAEKKILWLKLRVEGVAGHGSQPHDQNPNDRLIRALARLQQAAPSSGPSPVLETLRQQVGTLAANKFTNAIQRSTITVTTLRAGVGDPPKVNVIPSVAEATLDCRLLPGVSPREWLAELRKLLGDPGLSVEITYESDEAVVTPIDTPLYRALAAAVRRQHPEAVVAPILVPYGTDSNAFRPRGVTGYGFFPVVLPAAIVASMHSDAERIPIAELSTGAQILYEALSETLTPRR